MYSGENGCNRAKLVLWDKSGGIWAKWLCSGKSACTRAKLVVLGRSGSTREKAAVFV